MMNNTNVDLNNVMNIWGELNVLMKKCNYQSKQKCSPLKKINMVLELG